MQKNEIWTEDKLDALLTTPSQALVGDVKKLDGDVLVLGAGGKMGPTLCLLLQNALREAGMDQQIKVMAVSRFSDPLAVQLLRENGVQIIMAMVDPRIRIQ